MPDTEKVRALKDWNTPPYFSNIVSGIINLQK